MTLVNRATLSDVAAVAQDIVLEKGADWHARIDVTLPDGSSVPFPTGWTGVLRIKADRLLTLTSTTTGRGGITFGPGYIDVWITDTQLGTLSDGQGVWEMFVTSPDGSPIKLYTGVAQIVHHL